MAKLKDYTLKEYPEKKGLLEGLVGGYKRDVKAELVKEEVGEEQYDSLQKLKNIRNMVSIPQARLPFDLNIR